MNTLSIKRGETLDLACTYVQGGEPINITGWTIDSWVRDPAGTVVHRFVSEITDAEHGAYRMRADAAQTASWPLGGLSMDIRYTDAGGGVVYSPTLSLQVSAAQTTP